jgi:ring-1,2-phenylacetyl-CoA epoxidase subunit PaaC
VSTTSDVRGVRPDLPPDQPSCSAADLSLHLLRLGDDALVLGQRLCQWIT